MERGRRGGGGALLVRRTVCLWLVDGQITINFRAADVKYGLFTFIF